MVCSDGGADRIAAASVAIGVDRTSGDVVSIPHERRDQGVSVIGLQGTGKSSLLERMILQDLAEGVPGFVIDPHGKLAQRVMEGATPAQADRIILLEAVRTVPFGLNLLELREPIDPDDDPLTWAADSVVETVKKLYREDAAFLPRLERYLDLASRTLIPNGLTLVHVTRLLIDNAFRSACLTNIVDSRERKKLSDRWAAYEQLRPRERQEQVDVLYNRLDRMLSPAVIDNIVSSPTTTVPFDAVLSGDSDSMLIVSLPSEVLRPERCDFIGSLLLCGLSDRLFSRSVSVVKPPRLHIYLDEYQRFATSTTVAFMHQGRKYGAGLTLAHQSFAPIVDERIRGASLNARTIIALAMSGTDAELVAREFPVEPREEWLEEITEDAWEFAEVPSETPITDILRPGGGSPHSDPRVKEAAVMLCPEMEVHSTHPAGKASERNSDYWLWREEVDPFLHQVMVRGVVPSREELLQFLFELLLKRRGSPCHFIEAHAPRPTPVPNFELLLARWQENARNRNFRPTPGVDMGPGGVEQAEYREKSRGDKARMAREETFWVAALQDLTEALTSWFETYLEVSTSFDEPDPKPLGDEDEIVVEAVCQHNWQPCSDQFRWAPYCSIIPDPKLTPAYREYARYARNPATPPHVLEALQKRAAQAAEGLRQKPAEHEQRKATSRTLQFARNMTAYRYKWLRILTERLVEQPICSRTTDRVFRPRVHHVLHSAQSTSDARAEFASLLTNPPEFVAQIKLGNKCREIALLPALEVEPNEQQVADIRQRSRQLWSVEQPSKSERRPSVPVDEQSPRPRIGRRPRPESEHDSQLRLDSTSLDDLDSTSLDERDVERAVNAEGGVVARVIAGATDIPELCSPTHRPARRDDADPAVISDGSRDESVDEAMHSNLNTPTTNINVSGRSDASRIIPNVPEGHDNLQPLVQPKPVAAPKASSVRAGVRHAVRMPELGDDFTEGQVMSWFKRIGQRVEVDEPLLEVTTTKTSIEIPSPVAGILLEITVLEDEYAPVGRILAVIGVAAEPLQGREHREVGAPSLAVDDVVSEVAAAVRSPASEGAEIVPVGDTRSDQGSNELAVVDPPLHPPRSLPEVLPSHVVDRLLIQEDLEVLQTYFWHHEAKLADVVGCVRALLHPRIREEQAQIMRQAILRLYNWDRASRIGDCLPFPVEPVAKSNTMVSLRVKRPYELQSCKFGNRVPPATAARTIATVLAIDPPDDLFYVTYDRRHDSAVLYPLRRHWLYGQYGDFNVLLVTWEDGQGVFGGHVTGLGPVV